LNYYKRHLGDYARKAGHLSMLEHGAYTLILDAYYDREQAPTKAEAIRWARARNPDETQTVSTILQEFFFERDGRYYQQRVEDELEAAKAKAEHNRAIGKLGGRPPRERKTQRVTSGLPNGFQTEPQSTNPLIQDLKHDSPNGESSPSAVAEGPPTRSDAIPYQAIVDVFNRTLTQLPKARGVTPKRRTLIRSAWQAAPERRSIEFWEALAAEYEADDFTNGTGPYREPHANWRPNFDYLLRADVVTRTFERAMDRMERAA
jgi:uncharacterized protein YdaU (DUF1376 family)